VTKRNVHGRTLTPLQQTLLDVLWKAGPSTADAIRERLEPRHTLKDSTIRTLLRRLEARGLVTHTADGKVFVYEATMPPKGMAAGAVRQIIERFCSGSVEQFLLGLVDEKVLSAAEIRRLAKKIRSRS
jgi:BlaI family penicillinase repressor